MDAQPTDGLFVHITDAAGAGPGWRRSRRTCLRGAAVGAADGCVQQQGSKAGERAARLENIFLFACCSVAHLFESTIWSGQAGQVSAGAWQAADMPAGFSELNSSALLNCQKAMSVQALPNP